MVTYGQGRTAAHTSRVHKDEGGDVRLRPTFLVGTVSSTALRDPTCHPSSGLASTSFWIGRRTGSCGGSLVICGCTGDSRGDCGPFSANH